MRKLLLAASILGALALTASAADKKLIVMIAGKPSHGPAQHEHNAGIQLLAKCLAQGAGEVANTFTWELYSASGTFLGRNRESPVSTTTGIFSGNG